MVKYFIGEIMNSDKQGKFLKSLRLEQNITQQELGDLLHYSDKAISKWERGKAFPNNSDTLESIARIFNVTVEELLYGERKNPKSRRKIPKVVLVSLLIITFVISISCMSMDDNISYYSLNGEGSNFVLENLKVTISNNKSTLEFSKIKSDYGDEIASFILFYYENNLVHSVYEAINDNYTLEEKFPTAKYNLKKLVEQDVYLKVIYENGQNETIKLKVTKENQEDSNSNQISKRSTENYLQLTDFEKFLLEEGFVIEDDNFILRINNLSIYYRKNSGFSIIVKSDEYYSELKYIFNTEFIVIKDNLTKNKEKNIFLAKSPIRPQYINSSKTTLISYIGYLAYHYENLYQ